MAAQSMRMVKHRQRPGRRAGGWREQEKGKAQCGREEFFMAGWQWEGRGKERQLQGKLTSIGEKHE